MSNGISLIPHRARLESTISSYFSDYDYLYSVCNGEICISARNTESTTMDQLREENKRLHEELAKVKFN